LTNEEEKRLDSWHVSAAQLQDQIMAYLTPHGSRIGQEARDGSKPAQDVIQAYKFVHACPGDVMGWILLKKKKLDTYLNADLVSLTKGV
jgi:hypothetical protein